MMAAHQPQELSPDVIEKALSHINPTLGRDEWARMAMAIKSELGDAGFEIFDRWSQGGENYKARDTQQTFKSVKISGGVTIATLIREAKAGGFDPREHTARQLTEQEAAQRRADRDARMKAAAAEDKKRRGAAAKMANEMWDAAQPAEDSHPYCVRKGIRAHELRVGKWPLFKKDSTEVYAWLDNTLLAPAKNKRAKIVSLQGIFDEAPEGWTTDKSFLKDGDMRAAWMMIGTVKTGADIVLCEGYATGASIYQATGLAVVVAFSANNLVPVAEFMMDYMPGTTWIVAADNDQWSKAGDIVNPGLHHATEAGRLLKARVVSPLFANLDGRPTDFNDLAKREGADVVTRQIIKARGEAANDNMPPEPGHGRDLDIDPFRILGYDHGVFYIFQREKQQLVEMTKSDMTENGFIELANLGWWGMKFPKAKSAFDKQAATDWLMREAYKAGVYDPSRIRGRGAWLDEGRTVFHFGSHLWVDGDTCPVSDIESRYVYELDRELMRPADEALPDSEGQRLVEISRMFRWTKPASAALLSGFVALAPLCGALKWRPHIWITGGAGCGKTTVLNDFVHRLMGGMDIFAQGNSTEAGIRQTLSSDALPVLFDESEQNNEREAGRVQNVLSLIRQASSESAAMTLKGTAGGAAMHFHVRSMFCLSSIQVGMKHQADIERLTVLALRPKRDDLDAANTWDTLKEMLHIVGRDETLPSRLLRRSMDLLPTTMKNIQTFVDAASRKFGSVREGDQYGTLLAGCWSLMSSKLATPAEAAELIDAYDWSEYREKSDTDEATMALAALLEAPVRAPHGLAVTVYELLRASRASLGVGGPIGRADAADLLQRYGMRLVGPDLILANNSFQLATLFAGTPFAADWRGQILRAPGARRYEKPVRINGSVCKAVAVPVDLGDDAPAADEPPY